MLEIIVFLIFLYTLQRLLRRKFCKPDYLGKNIWITGASSGIGQYLAYQFSSKGANLIISARNKTQLERVKANCQYSDRVQVVPLDMTQTNQVKQTTQKILKQLQSKNKKLDVVVENAGVSMRCQMSSYSFTNHQSLFKINVDGPYYHIQCFMKHMMKNKSGQIVGITSIAGKLSKANRTSYAGSKAAFIGILDSLRSQMAPYNIAVTNIMPGYVKTNLSKNAFGSQSGVKFGQTDNNNSSGMDGDEFAKQAVKIIYQRQNQAQIGKQWYLPIVIALRNLIPDLAFFLFRFNMKSQENTMKDKKN